MSLVQASQHIATILSYNLTVLFESQLTRMNCQMLSTGFNSGDLVVESRSVMLGGIISLLVVCQPA